MNLHLLIQEYFEGFSSISDLRKDLSIIPKVMGVYIIVRPEKVGCSFTEIGTGGYFKGRNPNEEIHVMHQNWIKDANIIYIGKAGGENNQATLYSRIKQFIDFG